MYNKYNIQLFADAGAAAPGASATAGESEATTQQAKAPSAAAKKDPLAEVQYGRQIAEPQAKEEIEIPEAQAKEEKKKSLAELLKDADYKKEYDATVQKLIDRRFKVNKANDERLNAITPALSVLANYYGKDENDVAGIVDAVKQDDNFFKKQAIAKGTSPKSERESFDLLQENRRMQNELKARKEAEEKAAIFERWDKEIPEVKKLYPTFDLERESENPEFAKLATLVGIQAAYEHVHRAEINATMMQYARQVAAGQVAQSVAANHARPAENGLNTGAAPVTKISPRELTKEDRAEIRKRVRRGDKIVF